MCMDSSSNRLVSGLPLQSLVNLDTLADAKRVVGGTLKAKKKDDTDLPQSSTSLEDSPTMTPLWGFKGRTDVVERMEKTVENAAVLRNNKRLQLDSLGVFSAEINEVRARAVARVQMHQDLSSTSILRANHERREFKPIGSTTVNARIDKMFMKVLGSIDAETKSNLKKPYAAHGRSSHHKAGNLARGSSAVSSPTKDLFKSMESRKEEVHEPLSPGIQRNSMEVRKSFESQKSSDGLEMDSNTKGWGMLRASSVTESHLSQHQSRAPSICGRVSNNGSKRASRAGSISQGISEGTVHKPSDKGAASVTGSNAGRTASTVIKAVFRMRSESVRKNPSHDEWSKVTLPPEVAEAKLKRIAQITEKNLIRYHEQVADAQIDLMSHAGLDPHASKEDLEEEFEDKLREEKAKAYQAKGLGRTKEVSQRLSSSRTSARTPNTTLDLIQAAVEHVGIMTDELEGILRSYHAEEPVIVNTPGKINMHRMGSMGRSAYRRSAKASMESESSAVLSGWSAKTMKPSSAHIVALAEEVTKGVPLLPSKVCRTESEMSFGKVWNASLSDFHEDGDNNEDEEEDEDILGLGLTRLNEIEEEEKAVSGTGKASDEKKELVQLRSFPTLAQHSFKFSSSAKKSPRDGHKSPRHARLAEFSTFLQGILSQYKQQSNQHRRSNFPVLEPLTPAPTPALEQQQRLERIWLILKVPVVKRLDMVLCFSHKDVTALRFEKGVEAWEQAAAVVEARERAVEQLKVAVEKAQVELPTMPGQGGQRLLSLSKVERLSCPVLQTTLQTLTIAQKLQDEFGIGLEFDGNAYPPSGYQSSEECFKSLTAIMQELINLSLSE